MRQVAHTDLRRLISDDCLSRSVNVSALLVLMVSLTVGSCQICSLGTPGSGSHLLRQHGRRCECYEMWKSEYMEVSKAVAESITRRIRMRGVSTATPWPVSRGFSASKCFPDLQAIAFQVSW